MLTRNISMVRMVFHSSNYPRDSHHSLIEAPFDLRSRNEKTERKTLVTFSKLESSLLCTRKIRECRGMKRCTLKRMDWRGKIRKCLEMCNSRSPSTGWIILWTIPNAVKASNCLRSRRRVERSNLTIDRSHVWREEFTRLPSLLSPHLCSTRSHCRWFLCLANGLMIEIFVSERVVFFLHFVVWTYLM